MIAKICVVLFALGSIAATPVQEGSKVGCVQCRATEKSKINVHLVPHSHDDVGWLKTVDQYYFGLENTITTAGVQYIISSVVDALQQNPERRFIQVETAFFWKWWKSQSVEMREAFKSLVDNGQIEMVNGAWSMNDEACTNYQSTIDQFTWGLKTLEDTLGECGRPRVGWQIDPFGHSREQASIISQLGFDGVFFSRLDHDDKARRLVNKTLDFAWQGSTNIGDSVIFASIFPTQIYYPPDGFCWDYTCSDEAIDDNKDSATYNLDIKKKQFRDVIKQYAAYSTTNNILIPMGGDFQYQAAESNYINMDILIKSFEGDAELNVFYSTPSCYIQAVNNANVSLSLKTDDFFPYSEVDHSFWTGYFSSRPTSKRFERTGHNILQVSKQLTSLYEMHTESGNMSDSITHLREAMGVMQHHDAITGTEKQAVANDYARLLTRAIERAEEPLSSIISFLLCKGHPENTESELDFSTCPLANITICDISRESKTFVVAVYNPLAWTVTQYVRLPVSFYGAYEVNGPEGAVKYQQIPSYIDGFDFDSLGTTNSYELVFAAKDLPPMGVRLYHISQKSSLNAIHNENKLTAGKNRAFEVDPKTHLLRSVNLNGISLNMTQSFYSYASYIDEGVKSGAYVFRPANQYAAEIVGRIKSVEIDGDVVYEFHQEWHTDFAKLAQSIKWYRDEEYIELDWTIGDIMQDNGNEVITRFTIPGLENNGVFYTDSNGRETLKRTRNVHPGYKYNYTQEPVSSNYYPVTAALAIMDKDVGVAILNDRSQGGSSVRDGEIELMIHRRLVKDDGKGVDEALNEIELGNFVRGSHYILLGSTKSASDESSFIRRSRLMAQKKLNQPWIALAPTDMSYADLKKHYNMEYSALDKPLPNSINILTFEPWRNDTFLLRLENIFEKGEAHENSTEVDLENIFKRFRVSQAVEKTLGANEDMESFKTRTKYSWKLDKSPLPTSAPVEDKGSLKVSLTPMQIRTFEVTFTERKVSGGVRFTSTVSSVLLFVISIHFLFH